MWYALLRCATIAIRDSGTVNCVGYSKGSIRDSYPLLVRKFDASCKNHIIDGIRLPATTALGEKITYRSFK